MGDPLEVAFSVRLFELLGAVLLFSSRRRFPTADSSALMPLMDASSKSGDSFDDDLPNKRSSSWSRASISILKLSPSSIEKLSLPLFGSILS